MAENQSSENYGKKIKADGQPDRAAAQGDKPVSCADLMQLRKNAVTQTIFPTEVYPGYRIINESRRARNEWYSTGAGVRSFSGEIVSAGAIDDVTLRYSFLDYMRYVDIGVGAGTKAEDVDRSRKANYKRRYVSQWNRRIGRSHRPAIMMELRHLATRIEKYAKDFYGYEARVRVHEVFDDREFEIPIGF